jgi:hypothetical protein
MTIDIFGISTLDEADKKELVRKSLVNLTTSYSDEADVFTEIVQNAVDAIAQRWGISGSESGNLTIVVGRRKNHSHYLYVQDDGVGMSTGVVDKVFIPGFSSGKRQGFSIGYKGVGLSYVVAVSDHIAIRSKNESETTERTVLHTNDWVRDNEKPEPLVEAKFMAPELVTDLAQKLDRGTGVYFSFHPGSDPGSLDNLVRVSDGIEKELSYWASFLCGRTPLGLALPSAEKVTAPINVRIYLDHGDGEYTSIDFKRERYDPENGLLGYPFPELVFKVGVDTDAIDQTSGAQQNVKHGRKHQAVYHEWRGTELVDEIDNLNEDERALLNSQLEWVRGYLCYSTDVLRTVKNEMGTRAQVVRYGARLAVDGAPQGRPLELALTSDQGLDRQAHIVLGFKELQLDTGRKFVSDERVLAAINKVTQRVVTKLKEYRWALKVRDRAPVEADLNEWINNVTGRAGNSVVHLLFDGSQTFAPARVDPDNEQEVIALWTALVSTGMLSGFAMKAISGFNRYDALVDITEEAVSGSGPLHPISTDFAPKANSVLEFKWSFDALVSDFESKTKVPRELDLVVCWDCPDINLRVGSLLPVYGLWSHERPFSGVSYVWTDDANSIRFYVIALRNVVAELLVEKGKDAGAAALAVLVNRDKEKLV